MQPWTTHALLTPEEMAEADRLTIEGGTPGFDLMLQAGAAIAARAAMMQPQGQILVLCGPGNNGGDGYVAARLLRQQGHDVSVAALGDPQHLKGDALAAFRLWGAPVASDVTVGKGELIIDALFGAGLARPLDGQAAEWVMRINQSGAQVLAVDLPSGINGATGNVMGVAVKAAHTTTFFRAKTGHFLNPGRAHCGTLEIVDIGIHDAVLDNIKPQCWQNHPDLWAKYLQPKPDGHKYAHGHVAVIAGGPLGIGASRLAARAALRGGAGLVTLFVPEVALAAHLARGPDALMVRPFCSDKELLDQLADPRFNAIVVGPAFGLGVDERKRLEVLLGLKRHMVLDADALTLFAGEATNLAALAAPDSLILTPHSGEFTRLFGQGEGDKLARTRQATASIGQTVLHKGPDTVIADATGRAIINANAPPWLATAGSGDVLAGLIGAMLARSLPPFLAASAGAWLHGEAGNRVGRGLIADDLPEALPKVMKRLPPD